jgi:hypothetical protein
MMIVLEHHELLMLMDIHWSVFRSARHSGYEGLTLVDCEDTRRFNTDMQLLKAREPKVSRAWRSTRTSVMRDKVS